jgi:hypothetical protein
MINAATVIREYCSLMADLDCPQWAGLRIHDRLVRLLRMIDEVDETELVAPLAAQLAAIRRHVESSLWGIYSTAALAPMLAELSDVERDIRMQAELVALSRRADEIWGVP